jgi:hypothetical protein
MTVDVYCCNSQENFVMGAIAAAGSVTVMIPMDTVKTRLVIQVMVVREGGMDEWMDDSEGGMNG